MCPQVFQPKKLTVEERMVKRITELRALKEPTADETEELDVILHLLGVYD